MMQLERPAQRPPHPASARYAARVAHLLRQSQSRAALETARRALVYFPHDPELWNLAGCAAESQRLWAEAERCWRTAIARRPGHIGAQYHLGRSLLGRQQLEAAGAVLRQLITQKPDHVLALNDLGSVLIRQGRHQEALEFVDRALFHIPSAAGAHFNQGNIHSALDRLDAAAASFRQAIAHKPGFAAAHCSLGILHLQLGRAAEAEANFNAALSADPNHVLAYFQLAMLLKLEEGDARLEQLRALYRRRHTLSGLDRVSLNFAMAKALESLGRYDEAFVAFEEGNRIQYEAHSWDERLADRMLKWTTSGFTARFFDNCMAAAAKLPRNDDPRVPIFIVGMPRSGTTLAEQMLASHPEIFGAGELTDLDRLLEKFEFPASDPADWTQCPSSLRVLGNRYMEAVWKRSPGSVYISNKLPGNYRWVGWLPLMLPNARIIHCQREPMDTVLSCYTTFFSEGHEYAYDLGALARQYGRYQAMMEHWQQLLPAGTILNLRYEDVVENPEREARRMLSHIGLDWNDACLQFHENRRPVKTASFVQVRKPLYSTSVSRWKAFEKHLSAQVPTLPGR